MPATSSPRLRPTPPSAARRSSRFAGRSSPRRLHQARRGSTSEVRTTTHKATCSTSTWIAAPATGSSRLHWRCRLKARRIRLPTGPTTTTPHSRARAESSKQSSTTASCRAASRRPARSRPGRPEVALLGDPQSREGEDFLQYSGIPLKGIAVDPEDGALIPTWKLINSANVVVRTATGTTADLSPGANGWAVTRLVPTPWS